MELIIKKSNIPDLAEASKKLKIFGYLAFGGAITFNWYIDLIVNGKTYTFNKEDVYCVELFEALHYIRLIFDFLLVFCKGNPIFYVYTESGPEHLELLFTAPSWILECRRGLFNFSGPRLDEVVTLYKEIWKDRLFEIEQRFVNATVRSEHK